SGSEPPTLLFLADIRISDDSPHPQPHQEVAQPPAAHRGLARADRGGLRTRRLFWILAAARLAHAVGAPRRVHAQPQSRRRARRCLLEPALVPGAVLCDRHDGWRRTDRQAASGRAAIATRTIVRALTVPR